jgi:subtilisin family serine protease
LLALAVVSAATLLRGSARPGSDARAAQVVPTASVIVSLRTSLAGPANDAKTRSRLHAEIVAERLELERDFGPTDLSVRRTYQTSPAVLANVRPDRLDELSRHPSVAAVTPNLTVVPLLTESAQLIRADDAHADLSVTGDGVVVAVLDTGVDTDHPMLAGDIIYQRCYASQGTCPGGGQVSNSAEDALGHGTHVTGIITSSGPPAGIAPAAKIKAFKIIDNAGTGTIADVLSALDEVISSHPDVRIINMSVGIEGSFPAGSCEDLLPAFTDSIAMARSMGILTVASAGNSGSKTGLLYPGCLNEVVSVGAVYDADLGPRNWAPCSDETTAADGVVCFSQSSATLSLLAPGSSVISTVPGGGTAAFSGTSMAAPMASGVAALILEASPTLTADQLEARIQSTGELIVDPENGIGTCRVDAYSAVLGPNGACSTSMPPDADGDLIPDLIDNCGSLPNPDQVNTDGDALGDLCDPDDDNDGCSDAGELAHVPAMDPLDKTDFPDIDGSGMVDFPDFLVILASWNTTPASPWWYAAADIDLDGMIGFPDFLALLAAWGVSCP